MAHAAAPAPAVVTECRGDLFAACPANSSLAHCVSRDLRMGKGISVAFKQRYGRVAELAKQNAGVGCAGVLDVTHDGLRKFVYYLVTKENYYDKPTYATLTESLWAMRNHATAHGVEVISMPRIGCGLDRLDWETVKSLLQNLFEDSGVQLHVYVL
jgi:O-acetyl-ADP-ribose deacetylase (regulator of RNase III)